MSKKYYFILVFGIIIISTLAYARVSLSPGERQDWIEEVETIIPTVTFPNKVSPVTSTSVVTTTITPVKKIEHMVPFTSQAPLFQWEDGRFQDGCEEASALMAMAWVREIKLGSAENVTNEILKLVDFQDQAPSGYQPDLSASDTAELIKKYFNHSRVTLKENINADDIIRELTAGNVIVAPVNGRLLKNPYFTAPGPLYHMLVIIGYNPSTSEFITNDPGTRRGAKYRYKVDVFMKALRDYPSGLHEPIVGDNKRIVVVGK